MSGESILMIWKPSGLNSWRYYVLTKTIRQKDQDVVVLIFNKFKMDDGNLLELYAIKRHVKVMVEGPRDGLFTAPESGNGRYAADGEAEDIPGPFF